MQKDAGRLWLNYYAERGNYKNLYADAVEAEKFGSVIRGEETGSSDLDLLVEPTSAISLMDIGAIRLELKALLGVNVDVVTPDALPDSFREQVDSEAIPV